MRAFLRLSLILILTLTSITLGTARGQAQVAGVIVICAGGAVTTQVVDRDGNPVEVTHICPDMALSLMTAPEAGPPVLPPRRDLVLRLDPAPAPSISASRIALTPRARDPPALT